MKQRFLIVAGLAVLLAGGIAVGVGAQPGPGRPGRPGPMMGPGGPGGPGGPRGALFPGVDLSDAQREQIKSIHESHRTEFEQAIQKLQAAQRAFGEATHGATVDEPAIRVRSQELAAAMADEAILRAKVQAEAFAVLTAEQQEQVKQRRAEMQQRLKERGAQVQERRQRRQHR